jgi:hypothetical protein
VRDIIPLLHDELQPKVEILLMESTHSTQATWWTKSYRDKTEKSRRDKGVSGLTRNKGRKTRNRIDRLEHKEENSFHFILRVLVSSWLNFSFILCAFAVERPIRGGAYSAANKCRWKFGGGWFIIGSGDIYAAYTSKNQAVLSVQ